METVKGPAEGRMLLTNVSWETYEHLLGDYLDRSVPHFTYDRGLLEIMSPLPEHEQINRAISRFADVFAEEINLDVANLGSTTFKREDLERGFEPDTCFYIRNEASVRGKTKLDLAVDPPPDLVIEIDITNPSIDRFPLYAKFGVPEIWRHDGRRMSIFGLREGEYAEVVESAVLPPLSGSVLSRFVEESRSLGSVAWMRGVRGWARGHAGRFG
jgi:Uma2 family endonuclease